MSSHHIIRDEQEPPVLVFQLNENWQELSELLGWSPVLLINHQLKEFFELRQTKIDGFLILNSDYSHFSESNLIYSEENLAQSLLTWINTKSYTAVNIFCNTKLMLDIFHQLEEKELAIPLVFFSENGKFILKSNSIFRKWYPSKFKIDILNENVKNISNLIKDGSTFLVEKEGFVNIECEGNLVLINEIEN